MKKCRACSRELSREDFHKCSARSDGLQTHCIDCQKESRKKYRERFPERDRVACQKWRDDHPEHKIKKREYRLRKDFGITLEKYEEMYREQDGKCAICSRPFDVLCVDHDHATEKVRALLCHDCNVAIGRFHDQPYRLLKAIEYLEKYQRTPVCAGFGGSELAG